MDLIEKFHPGKSAPGHGRYSPLLPAGFRQCRNRFGHHYGYLCKKYGAHWAVDDVSFVVPKVGP